MSDVAQRLILPIPPSVNASHRNVAINRRIKTQEAKDYMSLAGWEAVKWRNECGWHQAGKKSKVAMRVWIFWKNKRRRDADNIFKVLQDSLTGVLWVDDSSVLPQVIDMQIDPNRPRVEIELEVMT